MSASEAASSVTSDMPGRRDPLFRDNVQQRYDILVRALRDIVNMRSSSFRTYQQDSEDRKRMAADALRAAGEDA